MLSKSLILFKGDCCGEKGQRSAEHEESRLCGVLAQLAHKVIHRNCGQRKNDFPIIDLGPIPKMKWSFGAQLHGAAR
ncbi:MAG TPA: hypothetical protein PKB14_22440 [Rubrivivax sp.]|nr:hypothetical protein [Rubrivivax sp.]